MAQEAQGVRAHCREGGRDAEGGRDKNLGVNVEVDLF